MSSNRSGVVLPEGGPTRRQTGSVMVLGGLFAVLSTALAYAPYVGPLARPNADPLRGVLPVIVTQAIAGLLLAITCFALPRSVRATRNGRLGQFLSAGSLALASLFPLPALAVLGGGLTSVLFTTSVGYLSLLGLAVGTALLARRFAGIAILTGLEAVGFALSIPLGVVGHWLLERFVSGDLPTPVFGPALFLAPFGFAWILLGYRIGTLAEGR